MRRAAWPALSRVPGRAALWRLGLGQISLINAGLIPETFSSALRRATALQPGASDVMEQMRTADDHEEELLPSILVLDEESSRIVLAMDALEERVRAACERDRPAAHLRPVEEVATLFDEAGARDARRRLAGLLIRLLRGSLPVKVVFFVFATITWARSRTCVGFPGARRPGAARRPAWSARCRRSSEGLRLLPRSFRTPAFPGHRRPAGHGAGGRFGADDISLSEVQTVCLRLWQSDNPEALLTEKGPKGLLEDYLGETLYGMPAQLRAASIALLAHMVTSGGHAQCIGRRPGSARSGK